LAGILLFVVVSVLMLGVGLLLWDHRRLGEPARLDQYERFLDREPNRFRHLSRIMAGDDAEFLKAALKGSPESGAILSRFWSDRRRVLRYTLLDLEDEFSALAAVGLMLAGSSVARQDSFAMKLVAQSFLFHSVCKLLRTVSYLPLERIPGLNPVWLIRQVRTLRDTTRGLLALMTSGDMDDLRDNILNH
jgi:hypothetical protein